MKSLNIEEHAKKLANDLSGGTKRKVKTMRNIPFNISQKSMSKIFYYSV